MPVSPAIPPPITKPVTAAPVITCFFGRGDDKEPTEVRVVADTGQVEGRGPGEALEDQPQGGDDEDAGERAARRPAGEPLQLDGDLGLGELDLLADERLRALGDLRQRGG